jgi:glycerophosphoryl diester phosphodiesterase
MTEEYIIALIIFYITYNVYFRKVRFISFSNNIKRRIVSRIPDIPIICSFSYFTII